MIPITILLIKYIFLYLFYLIPRFFDASIEFLTLFREMTRSQKPLFRTRSLNFKNPRFVKSNFFFSKTPRFSLIIPINTHSPIHDPHIPSEIHDRLPHIYPLSHACPLDHRYPRLPFLHT